MKLSNDAKKYNLPKLFCETIKEFSDNTTEILPINTPKIRKIRSDKIKHINRKSDE